MEDFANLVGRLAESKIKENFLRLNAQLRMHLHAGDVAAIKQYIELIKIEFINSSHSINNELRASMKVTCERMEEAAGYLNAPRLRG